LWSCQCGKTVLSEVKESRIGHDVAKQATLFVRVLWIFNTFVAKVKFFSGCHSLVGLNFAEVPTGYLLWCQCTAELHVLNDEYTRQWHLMMHIN